MEIYEERERVKEEEKSAAPAAAASTSTAPEKAAAPEGKTSRGAERRLAIRTRFCDDFFEDCAGKRDIKQVRTVRDRRNHTPVITFWPLRNIFTGCSVLWGWGNHLS